MFKERVIKIVKSIPKGSTMSYKQIALAAGNPGAARVVGNIMKGNSDKEVPCHRVIRSDGKITGYNGLQGPSREVLLEKERKEAGM